MIPLITDTQKFTIQLNATATTAVDVTATLSDLNRQESDTRFSRIGQTVQISTTTETDIVNPPKSPVVYRELERLTIFNPTGNSTLTVTVRYKDSDGSVSRIVHTASVTAGAFIRYSKENGWT